MFGVAAHRDAPKAAHLYCAKSRCERPLPNSGKVWGMTDEELMQRVADGQEDALIELHRRYANLVYSMAFSILYDGGTAEEVTQDVFMKVWGRASQFNSRRGRLKSWLLTVSRRTAIDRLRRRSRRNPPDGVALHFDEERVPSSQGEFGPEDQVVLGSALAEIPTEQRQVLQLAYFGGLSQSEIAEHLELPLGTVKTRIRLGMDKLRAALMVTDD